ncbi:hypothetical protein [Pseudomonas schmalbachii]|uniref:Uncharacterized protein n=1 Tax=Pseudomonas schmalbachii TaxID=2816993 RepID=A0ABS3TK80_9PSED|nr:hypothetical protein [Pseudomonas schmalbachii]MBO3274045.1 hypothetical protein [Pseudomonas schmalbachii]
MEAGYEQGLVRILIDEGPLTEKLHRRLTEEKAVKGEVLVWARNHNLIE